MDWTRNLSTCPPCEVVVCGTRVNLLMVSYVQHINTRKERGEKYEKGFIYVSIVINAFSSPQRRFCPNTL
jgi:hypothetical protein